MLCSHPAAQLKLMQQPSFTTERLFMRPFQASDIDGLYQLECEACDLTEQAHPARMKPADFVAQWLKPQQVQWQQGKHAIFAIVRQDNQQLLGSVSLAHITQKQAEVGYWVGMAHWNQGYATEACIGITQWAFEHFGLQRLYARCRMENPASGRVLVHAGYQTWIPEQPQQESWEYYEIKTTV